MSGISVNAKDVNAKDTGQGRPSSSDSGSTLGEELLADRLSDLARSLQSETDLEQTLGAIVQAAASTVPGAEHASISSIRQRRLVQTLASTGDLPRKVDQIQYDTSEGPCLDALYDQRTVRVTDLRTEDRWPLFSTPAHKLGVGSMLAVQLYVQGADLGAINLFSSAADAFDDDSEHVALLFASHASIALAGAQAVQNLQAASSTRETIGKAKGILMERFKIGDDQAFRLLIEASQDSNIKLRDVAEQLAQTGVLTTKP